MPTLLLTGVIVFLAELGDKTQLVCLGLVAKYGAPRVLLGSAAAALVNTALAVIIGESVSHLIPLSFLQPIAALGFVSFGLWTLCTPPHSDSCPDVPRSSHASVGAVFMAFLLAEIGDKTQLVTLGLAAGQSSPLLTWLGAAIGLFAAQALAIFASFKIAAYMPPRVLRVGAAVMFVVFGLIGLHRYLAFPLSPLARGLMLLILFLVTVWVWTKTKQLKPRATTKKARRGRKCVDA